MSDLYGDENCRVQFGTESKQLHRKHSFNRIVNTYNLCTQQIFFLPNILNWLKTSLLNNYVNKLIIQLKSIAIQCIHYLSFLFKFDMDRHLFVFIEYIHQTIQYRGCDHRSFKSHSVQNHSIFTNLVYFSVIFVHLQLIALLSILFTNQIPFGMIFLIVTALIIVILAFLVINCDKTNIIQIKQKSIKKLQKRKHSIFFKTISKVKLF